MRSTLALTALATMAYSMGLSSTKAGLIGKDGQNPKPKAGLIGKDGQNTNKQPDSNLGSAKPAYTVTKQDEIKHKEFITAIKSRPSWDKY